MLSSPVDLLEPEAVADPLATFGALRPEGDIWWLERHKAWLLLGYDVVREALSEPAFSTDNITPLMRHLSDEQRERFKPAADLLAGWMIFNDPPVHTALRKPVRGAFTPKAIARLEAEIATEVDDLLDAVDPSQPFDLVRELAYPLPAIVIAKLLGVPVERHDEFKGYARQLGALVMGKVSRKDAWDRALGAAEEFEALFTEMIAAVRAEPGEDLVSALVHRSEDGTLSDQQLVGACSLLLFGGHETTTSLLTSGAMHLLQRPDRQAQLAADPGAAVEELLRFEGPSKILVRRVREDVSWHGHDLAAGRPVFCALMAANHDPRQFDEPGDLRLDRTPNRHVSFGWGTHACLGSQLARLEARIVLPRLFARFPDLKLVGDLQWQPTMVGRTLRALEVQA